MKRSVHLLVIFLLPLLIWAGESKQKQLTFDQVYLRQGEQLTQPLPNISFRWADDNHYTETKGSKRYKVHARTGKETPGLDMAPIMGLGREHKLGRPKDRTDNFERLLFVKDGDIYIGEPGKKENPITRITETKETEQNPTFSPDGSKFAFTRAGNLYVYLIAEKKTLAVTNDGNETILNGYAAWIYYEEILGRGSRFKAYWWSPDSKRIVFMRMDQSDVPIFTLVRSTGVYSEVERQRYPKPGYPNPTVKLGIASIPENKVQWVPFKDKKDHYLSFPRWNESCDTLYFLWMARPQNHSKILAYKPSTKELSTFYEEKQDTWVEFLKRNDWKILDNGDMIIRSSKSGWFHLYYVSKKGSVRQLTSGEWSVTAITKVLEKRKLVFFMAAKEHSTNRDLYRIDFQGKKFKRLTAGPGTHRVNISPNGSYFIDRYSSVDFPPRMELRNKNGKLLRKLGDSYSPVVENYRLGKKELVSFKTSDGCELPYIRLMPPDREEGKKHPVVIFVYGAPGFMNVSNRFYDRSGMHGYFLAQNGVICIAADHRGAGHQGKKGQNLLYRNLGKWELNDLTELVKHLRTLPFVDKNRIGITGGSYGGYLAALALTKGNEYFTHGIAGAPVTDWALYDSVYTERYMGTPKNNPQGYKESSVFPYADKYKSNTLRINHGTMDDNVHPHNTFQLLNMLQEDLKIVETQMYPEARHASDYGRKRTTRRFEAIDFWMRKFFGKTLEDIRKSK